MIISRAQFELSGAINIKYHDEYADVPMMNATTNLATFFLTADYVNGEFWNCSKLDFGFTLKIPQDASNPRFGTVQKLASSNRFRFKLVPPQTGSGTNRFRFIPVQVLLWLQIFIIEPAEREHGGLALREHLHAKPKESMRSNEAKGLKNNAHMIKKRKQQVAK